jgi:FkbM family methyltransferase
MLNFDNFDWGVPESHYTFLRDETLAGQYEKIFKVEENDIVVDIGAFVGSFTYSILDKNPQHCWVMEPVEAHYRTLYKNLKGYPVSFLRRAISNEFEVNIEWQGFESKAKGITFKEFITDNCIDNIDFLKIDCEGGEYLIFTEENFDYLKNNVKKIAFECHLGLDEDNKMFKNFRDNMLIRFNYNVLSIDGIDIKWDLFNEHFVEYYKQVIIYIDNRN